MKKEINLLELYEHNHKAFLIDSKGYISNIFIWDNDDIEFVSGYLCDLDEHIDNINNFNNNTIKEY